MLQTLNRHCDGGGVALAGNMTIYCNGKAGFDRLSTFWHDFLKDITHA
tara:strand:- start:847 stop:990 length:144 start_codon:yes stop_codon:yes gene_type:complete